MPVAVNTGLALGAARDRTVEVVKFKAVREIGLVTVCQSERSCSSLVDEFDV